MKAKQVCKLQENLAKEAIAYLMLYGTAVDVTPYRKAVTQVGTAWGLPIPDTQRWLDLIRQEEIAVTQAAEPEKVNHVMEEKDLPIDKENTLNPGRESSGTGRKGLSRCLCIMADILP